MMTVPAGNPRLLKPTGVDVNRVFQQPFLVAGQLAPTDFQVLPSAETDHVIIESALELDDRGVGLGKELAKYVEHSYATLTKWFRTETPTKLRVILSPLSLESDGSGGAYHHSCDDPILYIDAAFSKPDPCDFCMGLWVALAADVFMTAQDKGFNCGNSFGEGLSRAVAEVLHPNVLDGYATAARWLDGDRGNYIDQVCHVDIDDQANGCNVLFLFWLRASGYSWQKICRHGAVTPAELYNKLTGKLDAFRFFDEACQSNWPRGIPCGLTTDSPWGNLPANK
jgi:hypothetical protein